MEFAIRLEENVSRRPDFIVDPAAGGIFRNAKDKRICNQLWHILVEQVLRLFDESSIVGDHKYIARQVNSALNVNEAAQMFEHDLAEDEILVKSWLYRPALKSSNLAHLGR